jgi:hypothetical protein
LLDEAYDAWDYILYLDTDILVSPGAPNIFEEYAGATIAGLNQMQSRDAALLEQGWLKSEFPDPQKYRQNYVNGAILLLSREFRQYLRGVLSVEDSLSKIAPPWYKGPHFYNHGGPKTDENLAKYFSRYAALREEWLRSWGQAPPA